MSCFTLSTDSICGPAFAGVGISTRFGFTSEPQFNAFIANEASAPAIASYFSCPAAGTALLAGVQYQLSISCASAAYNSAMQYGCASAPGGSGSVGLCAGACEAAVQSFQEALGGCAGAKVSQAVALFAKDCSQFAGLGGTCWNGTPQDVANCGFQDVAQGCAISGNQNLSCCQQQQQQQNGGANAGGNGSPVIASAAFTTSGSSSSSPASASIAPQPAAVSSSTSTASGPVQTSYPNPWLPIGMTADTPTTGSSTPNKLLPKPAAGSNGNATGDVANSSEAGNSAQDASTMPFSSQLQLQIGITAAAGILLTSLFALVYNRYKMRQVPRTPYPYQDKGLKGSTSVAQLHASIRVPTRRLDPLVTVNHAPITSRYVSPVSVERMPSRVYRDPNGFFVDETREESLS